MCGWFFGCGCDGLGGVVPYVDRVTGGVSERL